MISFQFITAFILILIGLYGLRYKTNLIKMLISLTILGSGIILLLTSIGYVYDGTASILWILIIFGIIFMFVGSSMALLQIDYIKLLVYSSVAQIGYVLFGLGMGLIVMHTNPHMSINFIKGGLYALNSAQYTALLFITAGIIMYRAQTTNLNELGGIAKNMPITTICFMVGAASISGLPPFNSSVSKWLTYTSATMLNPIIALIILAFSILTLATFIKVFLSIFTGYTVKRCETINEAPFIILIPMIFLAISCILMGIFPDYIIDLIIPVIETLLNQNVYIDTVLGGI